MLFAYAAQNEGELSVQRGDIVEVMEKPDPQWWRAQSADGQIGVLPATYLEEFIEGQTPLVGKLSSVFIPHIFILEKREHCHRVLVH